MASAKETYDKLAEVSKRNKLLSSCASLLSWDRETYMPPGGTANRAEQLALLVGMTHESNTSAERGEMIAACGGAELTAEPLSVEAVNLREWRREYDKATRLPRTLVEEISRTTTLAHRAWVDARKRSDFEAFCPWLDKILNLAREKAQAYGYDDVPYDALLDDYEPYETTANLTRVFAELKEDLVSLIKRIAGAPRRPDPGILTQSFPRDKQYELGRAGAEAFGFDFSKGRLDTVVHPFCCTMGPGDTRITTRYNERFFNEAFFGILHETGHGLYCQGLNTDHYGTPMGEIVSLGIHESQSRMWENFVGRGAPFWKYFYPHAQEAFPGALGDVPLDAFLHAVNAVQPSLIRVEADEATYNLHIILRFEIEQDMVAGRLEAKDVPEAWNVKFKDLLGIEAPDNRRGCLQDTHWSDGNIGYFPTYCLGNLYAAQFFAQARRDLPGMDASFAEGDFRPLLDWLRAKIHLSGQRYRAADLVQQVSGATLGHGDLIDHLKDKLEPMYGL